jgi:hypothetical protein
VTKPLSPSLLSESRRTRTLSMGSIDRRAIGPSSRDSGLMVTTTLPARNLTRAVIRTLVFGSFDLLELCRVRSA